MASNLVLGIILALAGGITNNSGALLQKYAVNKIPGEEREKDFFKKLLKNPLWLLGLFLIIAASGALQFLAQMYIGGALVPGLLAFGMVVLTIGAVKILDEKLKLIEYIGIALMIGGVLMIGLSSLEITDNDMKNNLSDSLFQIRLAIYSVVILILWIASRLIGKRAVKGKTIFLALGSSFPFAIANAWAQPFTYAARMLFTEVFSIFNIIFFFISLSILAITSIFGIGHLQDAFRHGDASIVYPIGQIPQQIAPIILFYGIYLKNSPYGYSIYLLVAGVIVVITAGFFLGARQGQLETIDDIKENGEGKIKESNSEVNNG